MVTLSKKSAHIPYCGRLARSRVINRVIFYKPKFNCLAPNANAQAKSDNRAFARTVESRGPARGRARAAAAGPVHMYAGVNSNSPGRSCDPEVRMRTDQRVPRGSRMPGSRDVMDGTRARAHGRDTRHGAQAQPTCANTPRPRPRRLLLGTFEKCLLRSTSIGCFCSSKPWQFYCWHAVASRNTKATHTAEPRGIQHLASLASSIRAGSSSPPSLSRRTNDAPWVPVMPGS